MPDEDPNAATLRTYERHADRYIERTLRDRTALVEELVALVPRGATVLELGSGPGVDALALEAAGFAVHRTDATRAFVERLREQGHDVRELNALDPEWGGPVDAVFANAVLLHFPPPQLRRVLEHALAAVRPGGVLAATLKGGSGEEWSTRKLDAPRHFTYWEPEPLRRLVEAAGWTAVEVRETTEPGADERWLTLLARRVA
ncbi:class I SAM-dependent methyltransferase [Amnibacterium sp. CER49]|uniref:class I SAM-dependent methyltransferase n=1 Tax=Amnibacterium sp. CER49 TaxID=3039161 RepID=UPI002447E193|nr:class I SAM-dependent methyltransferase [Amnibacterium sp. CER49]MDH2443541.1 class I SAM-dependent methyltransferase [Amnibacterium sp. CER49]